MSPSTPFNSYYDILLLSRRHNASYPLPHPQLPTSVNASLNSESISYLDKLKGHERNPKTALQTNIDLLVTELLRLRRHEQEKRSSKPSLDIVKVAKDINTEQESLVSAGERKEREKKQEDALKMENEDLKRRLKERNEPNQFNHQEFPQFPQFLNRMPFRPLPYEEEPQQINGLQNWGYGAGPAYYGGPNHWAFLQPPPGNRRT